MLYEVITLRKGAIMDDNFFQMPALQPEINVSELLKAAEINLSEQMQKPPICLFIDENSLFFLGDISTTIGKAKGRKTFASGLFLAALAGNCTVQNRIRAELPSVITSYSIHYTKLYE